MSRTVHDDADTMAIMEKNVVQLGPVTLDGTDGNWGPTARVTYRIDDTWDVEISRDLNAPTDGPQFLKITPVPETSENPIGGYDSFGIQVADLRAVPMVAARRLLEEEWVKVRAQVVLDGIPLNFVGDYAFAQLARAIVTLHGYKIANPVAVIARACEPHTYGTWATRAKRARARGFLDGTKSPTLTGAAMALLES